MISCRVRLWLPGGYKMHARSASQIKRAHVSIFTLNWFCWRLGWSAIFTHSYLSPHPGLSQMQIRGWLDDDSNNHGVKD